MAQDVKSKLTAWSLSHSPYCMMSPPLLARTCVSPHCSAANIYPYMHSVHAYWQS